MTQIYVRLLEEGTNVWRPVAATNLPDRTCILAEISPIPEGERWEFRPGSREEVEETLREGKSEPPGCPFHRCFPFLKEPGARLLPVFAITRRPFSHATPRAAFRYAFAAPRLGGTNGAGSPPSPTGTPAARLRAKFFARSSRYFFRNPRFLFMERNLALLPEPNSTRISYAT